MLPQVAKQQQALGVLNTALAEQFAGTLFEISLVLSIVKAEACRLLLFISFFLDSFRSAAHRIRAGNRARHRLWSSQTIRNIVNEKVEE